MTRYRVASPKITQTANRRRLYTRPRECDWCWRTYYAAQAGSHYCSDYCKVSAWRWVRKLESGQSVEPFDV